MLQPDPRVPFITLRVSSPGPRVVRLERQDTHVVEPAARVEDGIDAGGVDEEERVCEEAWFEAVCLGTEGAEGVEGGVVWEESGRGIFRAHYCCCGRGRDGGGREGCIDGFVDDLQKPPGAEDVLRSGAAEAVPNDAVEFAPEHVEPGRIGALGGYGKEARVAPVRP